MGKISQFVKAGALLLTMAGCSSPNSGGKDAEIDRFISDLMGRMTLHEKLGQLNLPAGNDGVYELVVEPLDPGIVFEKIVIDFGGYVPSYLMGNESPHSRK